MLMMSNERTKSEMSQGMISLLAQLLNYPGDTDQQPKDTPPELKGRRIGLKDFAEQWMKTEEFKAAREAADRKTPR